MSTPPPHHASSSMPNRPVEPGRSSLPISRTLGFLLTVLAGAAVAYLVWQVLAHFSHLLLLLTLAAVVAFIFAPLVEAQERRGVPRAAAILGAYLGALAVLALALFFLLGPLVTQLGALANQLPDQLAVLREHEVGLNQFFAQRRLPIRVEDVEQQALENLESVAQPLLGGTLGLLTGLAGFLFDAVIVLVLSFYLLLDSTAIHNNLVRLLPERWRAQAFLVEAAFLKVVGGYIRGQLIMALTIAVAATVGCWLLGVPYPLVVGLLAGLFELVPMLGPILAAVPALLISLSQPFPLVLWVALFFLVIQQIESNVIGPKITGHAVGLHPLGALIALLAGIELGGLVGALFAVPVAGIVYVLAVAVYWQWQGRAVPTTAQPSLLGGLARGFSHRRRGARKQPDVAATSPITTVAAGAAIAGGDTTPRPETLVTLEQQARQLHDRFEEAETARQNEQAQALNQAEELGRTAPNGARREQEDSSGHTD